MKLRLFLFATLTKMAKIMTVDNEPTTVELVKSILEGAGYKVITATSGQECLDKLAAGAKPDLILLDIMMPGLPGWEVYQSIRKTDKKVKVAFLSVVDVSEKGKASLIKCGLSDYIVKPFTADELISSVKKILKA